MMTIVVMSFFDFQAFFFLFPLFSPIKFPACGGAIVDGRFES